MLVFFFPYSKNLGSYVYDSIRARVRLIVFERHQRSDFFVEKLYGMRARVLSLCMRLPARARGRPRRLGCSRSTRRQRRKVDKCRVADKKQTNQQTNTHCSFIDRWRWLENPRQDSVRRKRRNHSCACTVLCW